MDKFFSINEITTKIIEVATAYEDSEFYEKSKGYGKNYGEVASISYERTMRGVDVSIQIDLSASGYSRNLIERIELAADIRLDTTQLHTTISSYGDTVSSYWPSAQPSTYNHHAAAKELAKNIRKNLAKEIIEAWNSNDLLHIREARELRITLANTEQQAKTKGSGKKRL